MRIPRFYQELALTVGALQTLDDRAVQHIARVLRMKNGELITLFNGDGNEYLATLHAVEKRSVCVKITAMSSPVRQSPLSVDIGQAISKGDRMDYAIQKSTELGMSSFTPLLSERSEVRLKADRLAKKHQQWQQMAISACEQSLRTDIPTIHPPRQLVDWIEQCNTELKLVLHHPSAIPLTALSRPNSVALLIGPEGGLSETEVEQAINAGFQAVSFGPRVLRTETAPIAAQAILQYLWGDLS